MAGGEKDAEFQKLIMQSSLAFWDAYLREDAQARGWLGDAFMQLLGENGEWEKK